MADKPIIVDGVKVEVTVDDFDDLDVVEQLESGNIVTGIKMIFGEAKYKEVKEALKDPDTGKTKLSRLNEWFAEVAEQVGAKN
jgi:hypothetical protein|nr:MAG TPA: hypothetical protein [Caudoviricetes sp.]